MKYSLTAAVLALLLSLTACEGTPLPSNADTGTSANTSANTSIDTADAIESLSEDEIYALLERASEIYDRMSIGTLDTVSGSQGVIWDGSQYHPVRDFETKEALISYLRESFTASLAESMTGSYRDIDGRLHTIAADRGTNIRASGVEYTIERIDDTTVKVTRYVGVWEDKACGERAWGIRYNVGKSPQELMLIWDEDRWVFDTFEAWDRLYAYDNGGGVRYEYAEGISDAIIKRDTEASASDDVEYGYQVSLDVGNFRENADGSVTATLYVKAFGKDERKTAECDYTFVQNSDGTWGFADSRYTLPERMFHPSETTAPFFEELTDFTIPSLDEIGRLAAHAELIFDRFSITSLDVKGDHTDAVDWHLPARDYETVDALRARLLECFSEKMTEKVLEYAFSTQCRDVDGKLYVIDMARGTDIRAGAARFTSEKVSDTEINVTRWVEVSEYDEASGGFVPVGESPQWMTLVYENGHWVFDSFTVWDDLSNYDKGYGIRYDKDFSTDGTDYYPYRTTAPSFDILTSPKIPSDKDIMRVFSHADLIWSAIDLGTLSVVYDASRATEFEGLTFYPVRDYDTVDDFRARLRECFTADFTECLIASKVGGADEGKAFYEVGGKLYIAPYAGVTSPSAGATEITIEMVDDTTVMVTRWGEVYDFEETTSMRYLVGKSPQEMPLVYEAGRWVFDDFSMWDNTSVYHNGGGVQYEYAEAVAEAFVKAEAAVRGDNDELYGLEYFDRSIVGYTKNADGSVTAVINAWGRTKDEHFSVELEYTLVCVNGTWRFDGEFTLPEKRIQNQ